MPRVPQNLGPASFSVGATFSNTPVWHGHPPSDPSVVPSPPRTQGLRDGTHPLLPAASPSCGWKFLNWVSIVCMGTSILVFTNASPEGQCFLRWGSGLKRSHGHFHALLAAAGTPSTLLLSCFEILADDPATGQMMLFNTLTKKPVYRSQTRICFPIDLIPVFQ